MKQVIQNFKTGAVIVEEVPPPVLRSGGVLVRNAYSLISSGTERSTVSTGQSNLVGKALKRPDLVNLVLDNVKREGLINTYQKVVQRLDTPKPLGYSSAGVVIEPSNDVEEFKAGDLVACAGEGYAGHAEVVFVPKNLCVPIPPDVDLKEAAFATLGSIALQGVRQAEVAVGDYVAVIGLGLVGLLTVQILKVCGSRVFGIDVDPESLMLAKELGADEAILSGDPRAEALVTGFAGGYGADRVIITAATSSNGPVDLGCRIVRDRGTIVIVGAVKTDIPRTLSYEKELNVKFSRSYGPGRYDAIYEERGVDYPLGYVRWTEKRNMAAFLQLVAGKRINLEKMTTHTFSIDEARKAYAIITGETDTKYLAILLKYQNDLEKSAKADLTSRIHLTESVQPTIANDARLNVSFIGAGNFAQSHLLPALRGLKSVKLQGVATATGINAHSVARKFGFAFCTSNYAEILRDPGIHCVFIATQHDLHANLVVQALEQNKHVFVEKPLALSEEELDCIVTAYNHSCAELMVGFNRRFSPLVREVKEFFYPLQTPLTIHYRVNAGLIPKTHWTQDPVKGGGRILGEVCHFVDLIQYLTESEPVKVYAEAISNTDNYIVDYDNVSITLKLSNGSLGIITYVALGDSDLGKERIEIFGASSAVCIEDFQVARFYRNRRTKKAKAGGKGHREEIQAFMAALLAGKPSPISFASLVATTITTLKIRESLKKGVPIPIYDTGAELGDLKGSKKPTQDTLRV